jgi:ElaB/YqjD/DUF883 family membrane-anchored ribosome-binding protein
MADSENMEVEAAAADVAMVPETLLKKRKRDEQWASDRKQQLEASRSKNAKNRQLIFKRAEQYIKEYRSQVMGITAHDWKTCWSGFLVPCMCCYSPVKLSSFFSFSLLHCCCRIQSRRSFVGG